MEGGRCPHCGRWSLLYMKGGGCPTCDPHGAGARDPNAWRDPEAFPAERHLEIWR